MLPRTSRESCVGRSTTKQGLGGGTREGGCAAGRGAGGGWSARIIRSQAGGGGGGCGGLNSKGRERERIPARPEQQRGVRTEPTEHAAPSARREVEDEEGVGGEQSLAPHHLLQQLRPRWLGIRVVAAPRLGVVMRLAQDHEEENESAPLALLLGDLVPFAVVAELLEKCREEDVEQSKVLDGRGGCAVMGAKGAEEVGVSGGGGYWIDDTEGREGGRWLERRRDEGYMKGAWRVQMNGGEHLGGESESSGPPARCRTA